MKFIADLHIHSKYARAVSPLMTLPELDRWADDKGILVMGTGDFTHPAWAADIKSQLEPAEPGLFKLKAQHKLKTIKNTFAQTRFLLSSEISLVYTRDGRGRRVHVLVYLPDIKSAEALSARLDKIGNIKSDGRPIIGLDTRELMKIVLDINPQAMVIPAHAWTPWFGILGSKSGFHSFEECFGDYTKYIHALETGLSSDPVMNWRVSALDRFALISNSDSHSLQRIGREANLFDTELSYNGIFNALKHNDPKEFLATIEYFPEEGMYHFDGHRDCGISYNPAETRKHRGICSSCGKPVTVGVLNRLEKLADRTEAELDVHEVKLGEVTGKGMKGRVPFVNLVTLDSIIGEALDIGNKSKGVKREYDAMINMFGSELDLLMNIPFADIKAQIAPQIAEAVRRMRERELSITPGYDGTYGVVKIFNPNEKKKIKNSQTSLFS